MIKLPIASISMACSQAARARFATCNGGPTHSIHAPWPCAMSGGAGQLANALLASRSCTMHNPPRHADTALAHVYIIMPKSFSPSFLIASLNVPVPGQVGHLPHSI